MSKATALKEIDQAERQVAFRIALTIYQFCNSEFIVSVNKNFDDSSQGFNTPCKAPASSAKQRYCFKIAL